MCASGLSHGGELVGLGAEWPGRSDLLVANLGQVGKRVDISGLCGEPTEVSELDTDTVAWCLLGPFTWRPSSQRHSHRGFGYRAIRHSPGAHLMVSDESSAPGTSLAHEMFDLGGKVALVTGGAGFLASDDASMVTGHVLNVDGGHTAR